jgi:5-methylcytosine-specific restriction endonuclease McrA
MNWFRWYHGTTKDPKWRVIAEKAHTTIPNVIAIWAALLENASESPIRGQLSGWNSEDVAACFNVTLETVEAVCNAMQHKTLTGEAIKAWDTRQVKRERDDDSSDRVARYRDRVRENGGTVGGYLRHYSALLERDGRKCVYCLAAKNLCIDHMIPICQGGDDEIDNLCIACRACNSGKSGRRPEEAGYELQNLNTRRAYASALSRHGRTNKAKSRPDKIREEKIREEEPLCISPLLVEASKPENPAPQSKPVKPKSEKRYPTPVPADFPITDDMRVWARENGFTEQDIRRETPKLVDHFRSNGEKKLDWTATWRNWLRNSRDRFGGTNGTRIENRPGSAGQARFHGPGYTVHKRDTYGRAVDEHGNLLVNRMPVLPGNGLAAHNGERGSPMSVQKGSTDSGETAGHSSAIPGSGNGKL